VVPGLALLALSIVLALVMILPVRRLGLAGWPPRAMGGYWLGLVLLGLLAAETASLARILVPILVVGILAPYVIGRWAEGRRK
jgi:hypothetical protein